MENVPTDQPVKSRLGRAKQNLQQKQTTSGPSFEGFQAVSLSDPTLGRHQVPTIEVPAPSILSESGLFPSAIPSAIANETPSFQLPTFDTPNLDTPFQLPTFDTPNLDTPFQLPTLDTPTFDTPFQLDTAMPSTDLSTSPFDPGSPMDLLSANAPTTPQHDITPDQLRALLLGEPDRFEHLRNATWDPATAVAQQPAWSSSPSETENPVPTLPDALPRTESRWNEAPSTMQTVNSGSFASPTSSFDFPISGSRPTVPVDLPGDARFRDTSEVDVAEVPKPKRTSKLKKAFEKQDGPPPPIADSLGDRSTKLLRIVAAGLLGLGLLLVGYIQFRDTDGQTPVNSIESVVVPNADPTIAAPLDVPIPSVQVVSTAPASIATSETTVALAGETETPSTAVTETTIAETTTPDTAPTDDFFAEGEDFSFSEPEDFSVK